MRLIVAILFLCLSTLAVENVQITSFNGDSIGLPKGTPVAALNGGFIRASTGVTNQVIGILPQDAPIGVTSTVYVMGSVTLVDWTSIVGSSLLRKGLPYYLTSVPGKMSETPSTGLVGIALSGNEFLINIDYTNAVSTGVTLAQLVSSTNNALALATNNDVRLSQIANTTRSNSLSPTSISFPASGVNWTNPLNTSVQVYIDLNGITGTTVSKNGGVIFTSLTADVNLGLQPGEYFSCAYTVGTPAAKFSPFP